MQNCDMIIHEHSVIEEPHDPAPNSEAAEAPTEDWKPDAAAG